MLKKDEGQTSHLVLARDCRRRHDSKLQGGLVITQKSITGLCPALPAVRPRAHGGSLVCGDLSERRQRSCPGTAHAVCVCTCVCACVCVSVLTQFCLLVLQQPLQDGTDPDPYVKLYLLPDPMKMSKRKTKAARRTCNPTYNEMVGVVVEADAASGVLRQFSSDRTSARGFRTIFLGVFVAAAASVETLVFPRSEIILF